MYRLNPHTRKSFTSIVPECKPVNAKGHPSRNRLGKYAGEPGCTIDQSDFPAETTI